MFPIVDETVKYVKFTADGGYPSEREYAKEKLELEKVYKVLKTEIYSWNSNYTLEGIDGTWNTCLFELIEKTEE